MRSIATRKTRLSMALQLARNAERMRETGPGAFRTSVASRPAPSRSRREAAALAITPLLHGARGSAFGQSRRQAYQIAGGFRGRGARGDDHASPLARVVTRAHAPTRP